MALRKLISPADLAKVLFYSFPDGAFNWKPQQQLELLAELIFFQRVHYQRRNIGR